MHHLWDPIIRQKWRPAYPVIDVAVPTGRRSPPDAYSRYEWNGRTVRRRIWRDPTSYLHMFERFDRVMEPDGKTPADGPFVRRWDAVSFTTVSGWLAAWWKRTQITDAEHAAAMTAAARALAEDYRQGAALAARRMPSARERALP